MSSKLIERIEKKLANSAGMDAGTKSDLLELLKKLRAEMEALEKDDAEKAESVAGFAGAATHEAARSQTNPKLLELAVDGLSESVRELEVEHPTLVETVNAISTMLSNLGI